MKKVLLAVLEPTRATLLIAFAIGLGIAVHPVFFLAALLVNPSSWSVSQMPMRQLASCVNNRFDEPGDC